MKVCPVHATYLNEEGIVGQIYGRCIGCRYCMAACPYNAKVFNWFEPEWPGEMATKANPMSRSGPREWSKSARSVTTESSCPRGGRVQGPRVAGWRRHTRLCRELSAQKPSHSGIWKIRIAESAS